MSFRTVLLSCLLCASGPLPAKPITYEGGSTVMYEHGGGTMREAQVYYSPRPWYSLGVGELRLSADDGAFERQVRYARANYLVQRWNLPRAQGNVFAWGGIGAASGSDVDGTDTAANLGAEADYETRRLYGSLRGDWYEAPAFTHRIDTLQLGVAAYEHEYDRVATWLIAQARHYTGGIDDGIEYAALVRLFWARTWGSAWIEGGATQDGALQAMFMINF